MATSTAQVRPVERHAQYEAAIASLQVQGVAVTAEAVWRIAGGRRGNVQLYIKSWKAAQSEAADAVPAPPAPGPAAAEAAAQARPVRHTMPRLPACAEAYRAAHHEVEQAQQRLSEAAQAWADAKYAGRQATARLQEASRRARAAPAHELLAALQAVEQAQAGLAVYVGEAEAARAVDDQSLIIIL